MGRGGLEKSWSSEVGQSPPWANGFSTKRQNNNDELGNPNSNLRSNIEMEPALLTVRAIMSPMPGFVEAE